MPAWQGPARASPSGLSVSGVDDLESSLSTPWLLNLGWEPDASVVRSTLVDRPTHGRHGGAFACAKQPSAQAWRLDSGCLVGLLVGLFCQRARSVATARVARVEPGQRQKRRWALRIDVRRRGAPRSLRRSGAPGSGPPGRRISACPRGLRRFRNTCKYDKSPMPEEGLEPPTRGL